MSKSTLITYDDPIPNSGVIYTSVLISTTSDFENHPEVKASVFTVIIENRKLRKIVCSCIGIYTAVFLFITTDWIILVSHFRQSIKVQLLAKLFSSSANLFSSLRNADFSLSVERFNTSQLWSRDNRSRIYHQRFSHDILNVTYVEYTIQEIEV